MRGAVLSWELLGPVCCPSDARLNYPAVRRCLRRLGSPAAARSVGRWWMMTSCEGPSILMGLSCCNQPHLGPVPTAPASGASFELRSLCFPEPCWRCACPQPWSLLCWLPGWTPDPHCRSLLQPWLWLSLLKGPWSDIAGSLASSPISWMDFGPTLQAASTALSLVLSLLALD